MKNKILKIGVLSTALITGLIATTTVNADSSTQNCVTHRNYYYFANISDAKNTAEEINEKNGNWKTYTSYPAIRSDKETIKNITYGRVCLSGGVKLEGGEIKSDSIKEEDINCVENWDLEKFYTVFEKDSKNAPDDQKGQIEMPKFDHASEGTVQYYNIVNDDGSVNSFFTHGKWYKCEGGNCNNLTANDNVDLSPFSVDKLIKNSVILFGDNGKTDISPSAKIDDTTALEFFVERTMNQSLHGLIDKISTDNSDDRIKTNGDENNRAIYPAAYTIQYDLCTIENTPEETEPDKEISKTPPTGDALIYGAWIIGVGALGYSVYYFYNMKKRQNEE